MSCKHHGNGEQVLIMLKDAPELQACFDEMRELDKTTNERLGDLGKMADRIKEVATEQADAIWDRVRAAAAARQLLPAGYVHNKTHDLSLKRGVLAITPSDGERCDCPACSLARLVVVMTKGTP